VFENDASDLGSGFEEAVMKNGNLLPADKFTGPVSGPMWKSVVEQLSGSAYPDNFDYSAYDKLARRFDGKPPRGGYVFKSFMKLLDSEDCSKCFHRFEIDTYGRGCLHNCSYCYAKSYLHVRKYWNEPIPFPMDIVELRKIFYTVFETSRPSKWRWILEKRVPLRIGSMSDSFMWLDRQFKVTQELLKILKFYRYPYLVFTRSDLVAEDDYMELLDKDLASVQMSISSINEEMTKMIEPGAPSPYRRLAALQKLSEEGFWTTVRINPLFPIYPDGYYTDPNFDRSKAKEFPYFSWDMLPTIAQHKIPSVLTGMVRLYRPNINFMNKSLGYDIREIFKEDTKWERASIHFSEAETAYYYREIARLARENNLRFSTCYIGNDPAGTSFEKYQNLWDNKKDCCDAVGNVSKIKSTSQDLPAKPTRTPNADLPLIARQGAVAKDKAAVASSGGSCHAVKGMLANLEAARLSALKSNATDARQ
jgi:DNA repair photolyase